MQIWKAIVLGLLQGITEFLPVSSTGHLAVLQNILQVEQSNLLLFDIMLHTGTLLAVVTAFRKDTRRILKDGFPLVGDWICNMGIGIQNIGRRKKKRYRKTIFTTGRKLVAMLMITSAITAALGLLLYDFVDFGLTDLLIPGVGFLINGIVLLRADRTELGMKRTNESDYLDAAVIGTAQGIGVIPGISRFGMTLTLAMCCGFEKGFAVKYSFLASVPAVLGAVVLEAARVDWSVIRIPELAACGAGLLVSYGAALASIKVLLHMIQNKRLLWLSLYSFLMGAVVLVCHFLLT